MFFFWWSRYHWSEKWMAKFKWMFLFSNKITDNLALHPTKRSIDWYRQKIHDITPLITYLSCKLEKSRHEDVEQLIAMCSWIHQQTTVETCFMLLLGPNTDQGNNYLYHYECLLLVTAMLERGLGNVRVLFNISLL